MLSAYQHLPYKGHYTLKNLNLPISATIVAAVLTGIGGGIIRDLLARRKPLVLRADVYAFLDDSGRFLNWRSNYC